MFSYMIQITIGCNQQQFGKTCALPLVNKCKNETFYTLELQNLTNNLAILSLRQVRRLENNTIGSLVFPFPLSSWTSLNEDINVKDYKWLMSQVENLNNTMVDISRIIFVGSQVVPPNIVRTFAGKFKNLYGYYLQNTIGYYSWDSKLTIYMWRVIFDRIPRYMIGKNIYMEYSFLDQNNTYCNIQNFQISYK